MTQETLEMSMDIKKQEESGIRIEYYTLSGEKPEIYMSPGDLCVLCNVLHDYSSALEVFAKEKEGYEQALFEYQAERCRKIQKHLENSMGYNVEQAIRKCLKKKDRERESDVGEDAFVLAVRARGRAKQVEAQKQTEQPKELKYSENILEGQMDLSEFLEVG